MSGDRQNTDSNNQGMNRRQFIGGTVGITASIANNPVGIFDELAQAPISSALTDIAPAVVEMLGQLAFDTPNLFLQEDIRHLCEQYLNDTIPISSEAAVDSLWEAIERETWGLLSYNVTFADDVADMRTQGIEDDVRVAFGTIYSRMASFFHDASTALKPALIELFRMSPFKIPPECNEQLGEIRRLAPNIVIHLENDTLGPLLVDSLGRPNELSRKFDWLQQVLYGAAGHLWHPEQIHFSDEAAMGIEIASDSWSKLHQLYFRDRRLHPQDLQRLHEYLTSFGCDWLLTPELIARRAVQEINALPDFVKTVLVKNPGIMRAVPTKARQDVIDSLMNRCARDLPGTIKKAMQEYFPDYQHVLEPSDEVLGSEHTDRSLSVDFGWPDDWRDLQGNDIY